MKPGAFGILEPEPVDEVSLGEVDLILVPGVTFDLTGHRIGHGHGYYDKLLEKAKAPKIGLAFECQIVEKIPHEEHDVELNKITKEGHVVNIALRLNN